MRVGKLSWTSQIKQFSFSFRASKDQFVSPKPEPILLVSINIITRGTTVNNPIDMMGCISTHRLTLAKEWTILIKVTAQQNGQ